MSEMSVDTLDLSLPLEHQYNPELEKAVQTIVEAFIIDERAAERLRPRLWDAAEKVATQILEPEKQNAIAVLTEIEDWLWFGGTNSPTPSGLISHDLEFTRTGGTTFDTDVPYLNSSILYAINEMDRVGLASVYDEIKQYT